MCIRPHTAVWVPEDDRAFATRLARYCARNPVALERLTYDRTAKVVTYRSDKSEGPSAGTETADPLEFLARVLVHIPEPHAESWRAVQRRAILTWHVGFWWSMVLDHSVGAGTLARASVAWPGTAGGVTEGLGRLQSDWRTVLEQLSEEDLRSSGRTRWPFQNRPFGDIVAWVIVELPKNAAELGYARFLYAVRDR